MEAIEKDVPSIDSVHAVDRHPRLGALLGELRTGLEALYGARLRHLVLYGSQARREAQPGSDVDVLVVLEGSVDAARDRERTGDLVHRLSLAHDTVVSCLFMSEERFGRERSPLLLNVHREGILL